MSRSPNNMVDKWEWLRLFKEAYIRSVTPENIKAGFTACGIYPLDQSAIPESAYAPSDLFDIHLPNNATASAIAPITPVVASSTIVEPMQGSVPGEMITPIPALSTMSRRSKTTTNTRAAVPQASMPEIATVPEEQLCSLQQPQ